MSQNESYHNEEQASYELPDGGPVSESSSIDTQENKADNTQTRQAKRDNQKGDAKYLSVLRHYFQRVWMEASPHEHLMLVFTCVIATSTFFYTGFAGWQLYEIHTGSIDTHNVAESAKTQALAALSQLEVLRKSLEYSERPWITVQANIAGPLTFTYQGEVFQRVSFRFKNIGRSPAIRVWSTAELAALGGDAYMHPFLVQRKVCDELVSGKHLPPGGIGGWTIFPEGTRDIEYGIVINSADLPHALVSGGSGKGALMPCAVGCVDYQFSFETSHHQTAFMYQIVSPRQIVPKNGTSIQKSQLTIEEGCFAMGGIEAN